MRKAARAFLEQIVDYAGLFPPARLPLPEALRHYTRHAAEADAWMLGRFVCPAARLGELLDLARSNGAPAPLTVAALGRGGANFTEVAVNFDADLRAIDQFRGEDGMPRKADVIEVPLPAGLSSRERGDLAGYIHARLALLGMRAFFEVPLGPVWHDDVVALSELLTRAPLDSSTGMPPMGLKIRCGGATPSAIPSPEQLAFFIGRCREARLPWKATAGLHHPLRHRDPALDSMVHGFLNVFAAGILARTHPVDEAALVRILCEESPTAFRFTNEHFGWASWTCTVQQVQEARRWLPSFGSCSFEEPRDDLRTLSLLA
jgi:hypothetical protein